ncbi:MAG: nitroreductase family protein [Spirochaetes bacterium]|nr:nitroreductase family protein [Spirochaetota bacterium]
MEFKDLIEQRRATRSLAPVTITDAMVESLAKSASLAPSCFNKQPWRFEFVYSANMLPKIKTALNSPGNDWAQAASLIIAVHSTRELDCMVKERDYFLFDTGMGVALMLLAGIEMGLVMHPIAGYDAIAAKSILGLPESHTVITLIIAGAKAAEFNPILNESQRASETVRPARFAFDAFAHKR